MLKNLECKYCQVKFFNNRHQLGGHLRHCATRKQVLLTNIFDTQVANDLTNHEMINLQRQKDILNHDELANLEAGFTKTIGSIRAEANIRIYLEICEFVTGCHGISSTECDDLINLVRRISHINGHEIPLPQKYATIHSRIIRAVNTKKYSIKKTFYMHNTDIFGINNKLGKIPAVVTDIMDVIASMLVDEDIYPNLTFEYSEKTITKISYHGKKRHKTIDVIYGEFYNSEFFKLCEQEVKQNWGPSVKPLVIFLGIDATNLTSSLSATPMYLSLGNMNIASLRSHHGSELCGFLPVSLASKARQMQCLLENGIKTLKAQEECITLHSKWLEQECLNDILEPVRW